MRRIWFCDLYNSYFHGCAACWLVRFALISCMAVLCAKR